MKPIDVLKGIAGVVFVLSLPVLFGTASLRWLVSDVGWYRSNFVKNGISQQTGISPEQLDRSAGQISSYLLLQRERIDDVMVTIRNQVQPLFNDREDRHMADVRALLNGFYILQAGAAAYAALYIAGVALMGRDGRWQRLGRKLRWGGVTAIGLFALLGIASVLDFDRLFLQFHLVSFDNDLWMLDPAKDRLVMMFPQVFWYDSTVRLATLTGAQALLAIALGTVVRDVRYM